MPDTTRLRRPRVSLLALPESTASVLYGLHDVLTAVGQIWSELTGEAEAEPGFEVRIVSPRAGLFRCYGGLPVLPDATLAESGRSDIVIVSDLAIPIDEDPRGRWPEASAWLRSQHAQGATLCSVCSGAVLLADSGLLDGESATTHWAFFDLFADYFPSVTLAPERILVPAGAEQRVITGAGATSWEDLALYLIGRFASDEAAGRISKVFLLGDRSEGQLPYAARTRPRQHQDAVIADCQVWLADHYAAPNPVARMVAHSGLTERTFKRRFRAATGFAPVDYVQTLRIEEAKQLLETSSAATDEIGRRIGYEDPAFFRRLFKRRTGVTPGRYRQRFQRLLSLDHVAASGGT